MTYITDNWEIVTDGPLVGFVGDKVTLDAMGIEPDLRQPLDGLTLPKKDYALLYESIGGAYGETGEEFNLPDLRGRVVVPPHE